MRSIWSMNSPNKNLSIKSMFSLVAIFSHSDTNQEEGFRFESLEDVETSAGCTLDILNILTDQTVLQKIQSGCDVAVNQAVNLSHVVELQGRDVVVRSAAVEAEQPQLTAGRRLGTLRMRVRDVEKFSSWLASSTTTIRRRGSSCTATTEFPTV